MLIDLIMLFETANKFVYLLTTVKKIYGLNIIILKNPKDTVYAKHTHNTPANITEIGFIIIFLCIPHRSINIFTFLK